jgi:hypothetical protein
VKRKRCAARLHRGQVTYPCPHEAQQQRGDGRWFCREHFEADRAGACVHTVSGAMPMKRCPKCKQFVFADDPIFH